jgi:hypothetical protein
MKIFLAIILTLSTHVHAQRSVGRESFMVNVKPALNSILNDFYQMIELFPEFPKNMTGILKELDSLTIDKEALKASCPRIINISCASTLNSLRSKLSKIKVMSLNLLMQGNMSRSLYISNLSGHRLLTEFDSELEEVKGQLDNSSFFLAGGVKNKKETFYIIKELDELNTLLSIAVVEFVPYNYKEDFRHFFFNFVHPVQQQISKNNNFEFLNRNINSLNFSINLLNQTLTKKKKTPEGMGPFLATIHNRWNSLIRYYF